MFKQILTPPSSASQANNDRKFALKPKSPTAPKTTENLGLTRTFSVFPVAEDKSKLPILTIPQLNAYFKKIGFDFQFGAESKLEDLKPSLELLYKLHELHVFNIPFENLSIHLNEKITIDKDSIFDKLVNQERGGYCYEMNGLFYMVLKTLGYDVDMQLAEVSQKGCELGTRKATHLILIVRIDGKEYLTDVGFGRNGLIHPLLLESKNFKQRKICSTTYEVTHDEKNGFIYGVHFNGMFNAEYRFDLPGAKKLTLSDMQEYSDYISKNPESNFTKMILVSKPTIHGRVTLLNDSLKCVGEESRKVAIENYEDYLKILASEFGIKPEGTLVFDKLPFNFKKSEPTSTSKLTM